MLLNPNPSKKSTKPNVPKKTHRRKSIKPCMLNLIYKKNLLIKINQTKSVKEINHTKLTK